MVEAEELEVGPAEVEVEVLALLIIRTSHLFPYLIQYLELLGYTFDEEGGQHNDCRIVFLVLSSILSNR